MVFNVWAAIQEQAAAHPATVYGPLIDLGAVGVCLVVLAMYFKVKDGRYEQRIDERLKREGEFQEKYASLVEKQHALTEKVVTSLEILTNMLRNSAK